MNDSSADTPAAALLGDEAAALGALHAGLSAACGYPGTPSTEILEYLIAESERGGPAASGGREKLSGGGFTARRCTARWCTNEKTALEAGLGVSMAGRRAMVTMKHVGLNVAADPFVNGALLGIRGGWSSPWRMIRGCTVPRTSRIPGSTPPSPWFPAWSPGASRKPTT
jgi:indolepyruvate ferredoxin oxidoreductase alpha subunit